MTNILNGGTLWSNLQDCNEKKLKSKEQCHLPGQRISVNGYLC